VGAVNVAGGGGEIGGEPATLAVAVHLNFSLYFVVDQRVLTLLGAGKYENTNEWNKTDEYLS
jgi:hypothetical protein